MSDQWKRLVTVTDSRRHSRGFTVYKVTSTVFPRNSPEAKTEVTVWKRYREFQKLYKDLKKRHENLYIKEKFPSFCKLRLFGRFESDVIEERRLAAQELLDFAAKYPSLFTSESCVKFFEKSHNIVADDDSKNSLQEGVLHLPLSPNVECSVVDRLSRSSSPSSVTDSESATSNFSSPIHRSASRPALKEKNGSDSSRSDDIMDQEKMLPSPSTISHGNVTSNGGSSSHSLSVLHTPKPNTNSDRNENVSHDKHSSDCSINPVLNFSSHKLKDVEVHEEDSNERTVSVAMDYITQAGHHISQAVEYETNSQYEFAFASYKAAISILLSGVQDDDDEERKVLVQRKASNYLTRAEQIYHDHLDSSHKYTRTIPDAEDFPRIIGNSLVSSSWKSLEGPLSDLKNYKVLGIVSSVILALNTKNDTPYIVKVLHKSSCPVDKRTKSIVPCNVPFMCRLHKFIENESAVFLILEQAKGGRLWDHINPYFEKYPSPGSSSRAFSEFLKGNAEESKEHDVSKTNVVTSQSMHQLRSENISSSSSSTEIESMIKNNCGSMGAEQGIKFEGKKCGPIPAIVFEAATASQTACCIDPLVHKNESNNDSDIENILKNSQKLLASVNITLAKSEEKNKTIEMISDAYVASTSADKAIITANQGISPAEISGESCVKVVGKPSSRNGNQSLSRERKSPSSHLSRSRTRYSCDDMFEGRARALSRSLDREALSRVDPRDEQNLCLGLPVDTVRIWAAQLLLALDALHRWGVFIGDLRPDNLLMGSSLNLVLTYQCHWVCVDHVIHPDAIEQLYAAPEICCIQERTSAADWWSYGAILYELLSGESLYSCHPGGFFSHSSLFIPNNVSEEGANLLRQLLRYDAQSRLGTGPHGVAKLKAQPFFRGIEWNKIFLMSASV